VPTPEDFGKVEELSTPAPGIILITDEHGVSVEADLDWRFVIRDE
jgi:hypothetical protein